MPKDWRAQVRAAQLRRRLWYHFWLVVLFFCWFGLFSLAVWAWVVVFGDPPHDKTVLAWIEAIGGLLSGLFARYGPVQPFRGRAPEEVAADAFFAKDDVRSDDHKFEPDLKD